MAVNIYEAHILTAMREIQEATKGEFGEGKVNDEVISHLAAIEKLTVREEATLEWERIMNS